MNYLKSSQGGSHGASLGRFASSARHSAVFSSLVNSLVGVSRGLEAYIAATKRTNAMPAVTAKLFGLLINQVTSIITIPTLKTISMFFPVMISNYNTESIESTEL